MGTPFLARWRELPRWDIKSASAARFRRAHPSFRPLGESIDEATELIRPWEEPEKKWPVYGVNNQQGVVFSHLQVGAEFNAPYKRIKKDWFFHNPTRANVGSLGRVPEVQPDAITSPEYQVWRIARGYLPDFVEILIRLPFFLKLIHYHRVGAVKERLFVENLKEIPVPPLGEGEQRKIVKLWRAAQMDIASTQKHAAQLENHTRNELLAGLGIRDERDVAGEQCFALAWSDLDRWSLEYLSRRLAGLGTPDVGTYPGMPLRDLCAGVSGGTPNTKNPRYWGGEIPWVSPKDMQSHELWDTQDHITETAIAEAAIPLLPARSIVVVMRSGILQRRVPTALLHCKASINQDMRGFTVRDESRLIPEFLATYLQARQYALLRLVKSSTTVQSVNCSELEAFPVPLPPTEVQRKLTARVDAARAKIVSERLRAAQLQVKIKADIEAVLLNSSQKKRDSA